MTETITTTETTEAIKTSEAITKDWTIMVYMAGDNSLSVDMAYTLNEIKNFSNIDSSNVNILAYYDGDAPNAPTLYCDFTDFENPHFTPSSTIEKRFQRRLRGNEQPSTPPDDENSAAFYSVLNFIDWCVNGAEFREKGVSQKGRKATNYAMIFSGHGFGFQSLTFLKDNKSDFYMTIRKLRAALERAKNEVLDGKALAILGFDSCVMGMLEVGFELKDCAKTMIASEGTLPNAGWAYAPILNGLVESKNVSTDAEIFDVSRGIVRNFIDTQQQFAIGGVSVDLSAWDLTKVAPIVTEVNKLGNILLKGLENKETSHQLELVLLKCHFKSQSFMFEQNVDLIDFCEILSEESSIFDQNIRIYLDDDTEDEKGKSFAEILVKRCQAVIDAVESCVLLNGFSGGKFQYAKGISIFFPWTYLLFALSAHTYDGLGFVFSEDGLSWRKFLYYYLSEVSLRGRNQDVGSLIQNIESKTTDNPKTKTTDNPKTRLIEDMVGLRITDNPKTKTTDNIATEAGNFVGTKTTDNPKTRMLDAISPYLYDFKNVTTPWFVAGFSEENEKTG